MAYHRFVESKYPINFPFLQILKKYVQIFTLAHSEESIALEIKEIRTECSFDYLFVFDGASFTDKDSVLLASFSGSSDPNVVLLARSGQVCLIRLRTVHVYICKKFY